MSGVGRYLRLPAAALCGAAVTLGLFLLMNQLISAVGERRSDLEAVTGIRFGKVQIPDEIVARSRRKPPPPPPAAQPPHRPELQPAPAEQQGVGELRMELPDLDLPRAPGGGLFIGGYPQAGLAAEGEIIPVVIIRPLYPREAAVAGIEGWVKVEFTITETGAVKDPTIVAADPPRVFNREAIRAILRWKFKPRVVDGVAVERRATQVIDFTLDEAGG